MAICTELSPDILKRYGARCITFINDRKRAIPRHASQKYSHELDYDMGVKFMTYDEVDQLVFNLAVRDKRTPLQILDVLKQLDVGTCDTELDVTMAIREVTAHIIQDLNLLSKLPKRRARFCDAIAPVSEMDLPDAVKEMLYSHRLYSFDEIEDMSCDTLYRRIKSMRGVYLCYLKSNEDSVLRDTFERRSGRND